jgi:hypothetical protein
MPVLPITIETPAVGGQGQPFDGLPSTDEERAEGPAAADAGESAVGGNSARYASDRIRPIRICRVTGKLRRIRYHVVLHSNSMLANLPKI